MASVPKRIWTPLQAKKSTLGSSDQVCTVGSAIYAANTDAMLCSNVTMPALASENQKCQIPLSIVYGVQSPSSAGPLAIYSHSVVFGSGICSNFSQRHYYTLLGNYLEWGASVVSGGSSGSTDAGVTTSVASMTGTKTPTISTEDSTQTTLAVKAASVSDGSSSSGGFSMNIPSGGSQEIYVYGGNLYPLIEAQGAASDAQISPTTTITVHVTSTVFAGGANTGTATSAAPSENEISTPAPTGTDMSGMTGTDMSGMTGTDMSGMTGTDMSGMTGTDMSGMTGTDMLGMTGTDMSGMTGTDMSGMTGTDMSGMTGTDMSGMTGTDPTGTANTSDSSAASNSSNDNVVSSDVANIVTVNTLDSSDMSLLGISDTNSSIDSKSSPTESSNGDETGTNSSDASASPTDTSNPDKVEQSNNQAKTSSMSTAAKVAIAVVVLLGIGAFGGGYWFYTRRRKKQQQQNNRRLSDSI
ncbi:hypothetical protein IW150_001488 [Coemansia sp. RSA 2607]|nr:hypothetical protein IW150_001488 [Coemansia sp. RSA 2607]KAJ2397369.1 hypothetical protein GGI05_000672 [Coemansia sp. RSA 2603]